MITTFFVDGKSAPKGSTFSFKNKKGKIITMQEGSKKLYAWQDAIGYVAKQNGVQVSDGAIHLKLNFFMLPPNKSKYWFPPRPDLDKLCRSCLDALSGVAYADDFQVVSIQATKQYSTHRSGVAITIQTITEEELWQEREKPPSQAGLNLSMS